MAKKLTKFVFRSSVLFVILFFFFLFLFSSSFLFILNNTILAGTIVNVGNKFISYVEN